MRKIKADDFFENGFFEVARYGNTIVTQNDMTEEQYKEWVSKIAEHYMEEKEETDALIKIIRGKLALVNPLDLFNFLTSMNTILHMSSEVTSEMEETVDVYFLSKSLEYIQSLLVSTKHDKLEELSWDEQEVVFHELVSLCSELYRKIPSFYLFWAAKQQVLGKLNREDMEYIVYAQMMSQVRGKQYQVFRIPVLKELLLPQEELLQEVYGLSVSSVISGLEKMEINLSSGRLDAMKALCKQIDGLAAFDGNRPNEKYMRESKGITLKAVGTALFEIKENTDWNDELINDLSLGVNEDQTFFMHEEFPGWPIWNLPIQYKPFITIDGKAYCFDYNILFDNFYVAIQKAIRSHGNDYGDRWSKHQKYASEKSVGNVFESLLPGCTAHYSNFYPLKKKESAENDILIEYKDVLIIVEVKAGTFVYTPAMMDYPAHKKTFVDLVENAEKQCIRVKNYILSGSEKERFFYTDDTLETEAFSLDRDSFSQIYMFDVTVSDFNEFASQMEKVDIAKAHEGVVALSLNDLWVYKAYFDNPLQFVHFIRQRTIATETKEIVTSDELDHLGMYIFHNVYSLQAKAIGQGNRVNFIGYRDELDKYFASIHIGREYEKPSQHIPEEISHILHIVQDKNNNVTTFANFLLDFSFESRIAFGESISNLVRRERELGRMVPAVNYTEMNYVLYAEVPNIRLISKEEKEKYVLANLAINNRDECWLITVVLDEKNTFLDVQYNKYRQTDIPEDKREELRAYGKEIIEHRTEQYLSTVNRKKIYPNDPCPCGSGKKYKKCCGKRN